MLKILTVKSSVQKCLSKESRVRTLFDSKKNGLKKFEVPENLVQKIFDLKNEWSKRVEV